MGILNTVGIKTVSIILYGSTARGATSDDSDIDIAVIVNGALDFQTEDALSDVVVDMNLKYDKVFSVIDIEDETTKNGRMLFHFIKTLEKRELCYGRQHD